MQTRANRHAEVQQQHTLTAKESTKITRFGVNATYEMLKRGEMPGIKVGKKWFIPRVALLRWLEQCGSSDQRPAA